MTNIQEPARPVNRRTLSSTRPVEINLDGVPSAAWPHPHPPGAKNRKLSTRGQWALWWASIGYKIIPGELTGFTEKNGLPQRKAHISGWQKAATTDPEQIISWWKRWPDALVGIVPDGGQVVADIDNTPNKHGAGRHGAVNLEKLGIVLPPSPIMVRSGGGEYGYWFGRIPEGVEVEDIPRKPVKDVDLFFGGKGYFFVEGPHWSVVDGVRGFPQLLTDPHRAMDELPELPVELLRRRESKPTTSAPRFGSRVRVDLSDEPKVIAHRIAKEPPTAKLRNMLKHVSHGEDDNRALWLSVGQSLHDYSDGADWGQKLWIEWSKGGERYINGDCYKQWDSFGRYSGEHVTILSLLKLAREGGWRGRLDDVTTAAGDDEAITEANLASAFIASHRAEFRHVVTGDKAGYWLRWDGNYWKRVDVGEVRHVLLGISTERARNPNVTPTEAAKAGGSRFIGGALTLASDNPAMRVTPDRLNKNPYLLATPGGTYDLRTGQRQEPNPDDLITMITTVAPSFEPPALWNKALLENQGGDKDTIRTIQQYAGYCLTGATNLEKFMILHGDGGTGKSLVVDTIKGVMGEGPTGYAAETNMTSFCEARNDRTPFDIAPLRGKRAAIASEAKAGRRWDQERVTSLTGNETVTARDLFESFATTPITFKLLFAVNYLPHMPSPDEAMRRRTIVVPFNHPPAAADDSLKTRMKEEFERGKILGWMIKGAVDLYKNNGLYISKRVQRATDEYFRDEDIVLVWLDSNCARNAKQKTSIKALLENYNHFCQMNNVANAPCNTIRTLPAKLRRMGFDTKKSNGEVFVLGVLLNEPRWPSRPIMTGGRR